ncbi:hypothetical protein BD410DRAFT_788394 [Rickenella mellea]|uniref:Uncharacterized protein n=1 Tax=Rickenella mellea TaxID=50990 RepID=A0A4Y7Q5J7_9AGAM|nr:hypothetical protein BD410DRAFT_788394 [Rickenella mellea]
MSVALAFYYFSRRLEGVQALPFVEINRCTTSICDDLSNCRTTTDIVWSCLTTIFTCTWVAIHPNIPAPYESSFEIGLRRFGIVIMALIAPEFVIVWALRQWTVSRRLAKEHLPEGWTQTHGFFALMGGFMLFSGDTALYTLSPEKLNELSKDGRIVFPKISREDIEDKSKGDIISKGFVIIQTSWFVLQCIARGVERLPITELELVTLAFAVLNLATYALWWNKPLNIQRPFAVQLSNGSPDQVVKGAEVPGMFRRAMQQITKTWADTRILLPIMPFAVMIRGGNLKTGAKKVPSFYSSDGGDNIWTIALASAAIAVIFGAIHCIAWSFDFPSHQKMILWRTCAIVITCLPVTLLLFGKMVDVLDDYYLGIFELVLLFFAFYIFPIFYIFARVILLVEAFTLLKSLPPGAFQTVQWTSFIPHV